MYHAKQIMLRHFFESSNVFIINTDCWQIWKKRIFKLLAFVKESLLNYFLLPLIINNFLGLEAFCNFVIFLQLAWLLKATNFLADRNFWGRHNANPPFYLCFLWSRHEDSFKISYWKTCTILPKRRITLGP